MRGSIVNLVSSTIGASTITIPYILAISGLLGGILWIIIGALLTFYSGRLLVGNHCYVLYFRSNVVNSLEKAGMSD